LANNIFVDILPLPRAQHFRIGKALNLMIFRQYDRGGHHITRQWTSAHLINAS
jgi:hypothetical protein